MKAGCFDISCHHFTCHHVIMLYVICYIMWLRWGTVDEAVLFVAEFKLFDMMTTWHHHVIMSSCAMKIAPAWSPAPNNDYCITRSPLIKQQFSKTNKKSPTQNAFYLRKTTIFIKIAPIIKWLKKSNAKRIFKKENSHFHQDRPHRKMIEKVQRKMHFR